MKGMNRIRRGKNFRGVISYALSTANHHRVDPIVIGGNLVGSTVDELATEFTESQKLRTDVQKPVWHNSLRLPRGDSLTHGQWTAVADDYMDRMGFSKTHLRCYVLHDDEAGQHIHIIASRIDLLNGQLYLGRNENLISTRIIQDLEKAHHLTQTVGPSPARTTQKNRKLTRNENIMEARTGEKSSKKVLQDAIDAVLSFYDHITIDQFVYELGKLDIAAKANVAATGKMNGFSFEHKGVAFKASQLGKTYGWSNLGKRIIVSLPIEAAPPLATSGNENFPVPIQAHPIATSTPPMDILSEQSRFHWLQWIPYLDELVSHLKAVGSTILNPLKKNVIYAAIRTGNSETPEIFEVNFQSSAMKNIFKRP
ncbi:relaxase/mobilization nuclease domain-containing protein [Pantoea allii]|uniref:relaxase/mobilization nuclease domain-containing protein n=1 Tax=Pantoea allii TaxID=574096 RepID=UPI003D31B524